MHILKTFKKHERHSKFEVSSEREVRGLVAALRGLVDAFAAAGVEVACEYHVDDEAVVVAVGTSPEHIVPVGGDSVLAALNDVYTYIWLQV